MKERKESVARLWCSTLLVPSSNYLVFGQLDRMGHIQEKNQPRGTCWSELAVEETGRPNLYPCVSYKYWVNVFGALLFCIFIRVLRWLPDAAAWGAELNGRARRRWCQFYTESLTSCKSSSMNTNLTVWIYWQKKYSRIFCKTMLSKNNFLIINHHTLIRNEFWSFLRSAVQE